MAIKHYKNFTPRTVVEAQGPDGISATFTGAFYDRSLAQAYKNIRHLVLCERAPNKQVQKKYGVDYKFLETKPEVIQEAINAVRTHDAQWQRPAIVLETQGREIKSIFAYAQARD